ncbi:MULTISPECIES: DUF1634 domain-containing protein [unclassified Gemella]|uniref:DUF1634 domain-containing protein n=1 Tax=unclassified Gemella TaxID=2624949 RepID=UPI0010741A02|nr:MULTISPECIES: DUF1634 domain-containing protein [unclassified Gemella]MBF0709989.1 DUF1634 domain-containing protein [Gemella sp. GL1.1]MBF0746262.1 DUF1634 domain-containing protein [Gemella sp. 19428wG2_WT2a]NYS27333.1 DUF1634 domain-containing protein [Gemella sp. GL1]TFU60541.1 DUF1634 domain-containing protein [Gemella sp. WT2a]
MNLKKIEKILSNLLFLGVILSSGLIIFASIFGNNKVEYSHIYRYNFNNMINGLLTLDTASYYMLGIFILILTPIVRVVSMLIQFVILKDKKYVVISFLVLLVLSISLIFGITH